MNRRPFLGSLQARLVARLAAVFLAATLIGVAALIAEAYRAAHSLHEIELAERATDLARGIAPDPFGQPVLTAPLWMEPSRRGHSQAARTLYAIQTAEGAVIASSDAEMARIVSDTKRTPDQFFMLDDFGPDRRDYYGLTVERSSAIGPIFVTVARFAEGDELAEDMFRQFVMRAAWAIPVFAAATLVIAAWTIRRSLRSVRIASERASMISPGQVDVRLPIGGLPDEIRPLVDAVNRALDRLAHGFFVQRSFTANAAHELRTPLAILSAGLERLGEGAEIRKLRDDAERMNRLVDQLLRIARLDSITLDVSSLVDLREIAMRLVEDMAPLAILHRRRLALEAPAGPVFIRGNEFALYDALRNLVENALHHTPSGSEVTVSVTQDGRIEVADFGPGVPETDRGRVFERFWRGRGAASPGAGLGLSIVAEIATAHSATVLIADRPEGGTIFGIRFDPAA